MNDDGPAIYEAWDMTAPVVPPRSRLFHISPAGLGTPLVECLTSYFSRVAQAHSVSPGALQNHEVPKYGARRVNIFYYGLRSRVRSFTASINGTGAVAADYVSAIGRLTAREDLRFLTMIPWKSLFPAPMLMRGVAAWCPVCLTSWEKAGSTVYAPLLWTLEAVKFCPCHRHPLRLTCPHCSQPQPLLGQQSWVGFCTHCKRWLGLDSGTDHPDRYSALHQGAPEWEVWAAGQIGGLIEAGFHNPPLVTTEQLAKLVRIGSELEGLSSFARILGVSSTSVCEWRRGVKHPILPAYLRLARTFNVTLADLLTGKVSPDELQTLNFEDVPHWRNLCARRHTRFNKAKAAHEMDEALREVPAPSLNTLEKRTGYHKSTLQIHFPDQCNAVKKRYRQFSAASFQERQTQKIAEFRQVAHQLHEQGTELFVNTVLKRMSVPKSLDFRIARVVLAEVKREIQARYTHADTIAAS
jgi:DNA-binding transcriptional regulator YdaS (Cro superfamily)